MSFYLPVRVRFNAYLMLHCASFMTIMLCFTWSNIGYNFTQFYFCSIGGETKHVVYSGTSLFLAETDSLGSFKKIEDFKFEIKDVTAVSNQGIVVCKFSFDCFLGGNPHNQHSYFSDCEGASLLGFGLHGVWLQS